MKIVAVNGSQKGAGGNTDIMVSAFLLGAQAAGAQTANILLAEKEIKYCRACKYCWFKNPGQCVLADDMAALLPLVKSADVLVWATPLYFDNVSGLLKTFIDRLMVIGSPYWTRDAGGECRHQTVMAMPQLIMLANCGYPERSHFQVVSHWIRRHARNLGTAVIGEIYASEGALISSPAEEVRPVVARYLQSLEQAGAEIATGLKLSAETQQVLEQPFIPADTYIQGVSQYIAGMLKR
jgi:putative NADPH-quinone reductase